MQRRVLLLGTSLALDSIGAALGAVPGFDLHHLDCAPAGAAGWLDDIAADVVIFDMSAGLSDWALFGFAAHPDLILVGFDLESQQMLLLSGEPARLSTIADLMHMLCLDPK